MMKEINLKNNCMGYINRNMLSLILSKKDQRRTENIYIIRNNSYLEGF